MEVHFRSKQGVERLLAEPVLKLRDHVDVFFEYRGVRTREVRVFYYPLDLTEGYLLSALGEYGQVHACSNERIRNHPGLLSGVKRVKLDMRRPVPNYLTVRGFVIQCEYEGVVRTCRRCGANGHVSTQCRTPKCTRCGEFGHETCDASCPRCGEDHPVHQCRRRTYAVAAGFTRGAVPAIQVVEAPQEPASQDTEDAESPAEEPATTQDPAKDNEEPSKETQEPTTEEAEKIQEDQPEGPAGPSTDSQGFTEVVSKRRRKRKRGSQASSTHSKDGLRSASASPGEGCPSGIPEPAKRPQTVQSPVHEGASSGESSSDEGESAEEESTPDDSSALTERSGSPSGKSDASVLTERSGSPPGESDTSVTVLED